MSSDEMDIFAGVYADQFNCSIVVASKVIGSWTAKLYSYELEKVKEAMFAIMLEGKMPRGHGDRIVAIIRRMRGGTVDGAVSPPSLPEDESKWMKCLLCSSGYIEVPHPSDFEKDKETGLVKWRGEHSIQIACNCWKGRMAPAYYPRLHDYELKVPNWRDEYPIRRLEWRIKVRQEAVNQYLDTPWEADKNKSLAIAVADYDLYIESHKASTTTTYGERHVSEEEALASIEV